MASTTVSAGKSSGVSGTGQLSKDQISESIGRLSAWLEKNDYRGYDTFDGLNAKYLRPLTFETKFLRTVFATRSSQVSAERAAFVGNSQEPLYQRYGLSG